MLNQACMNLKVMLPFCLFAIEAGVIRIFADTDSGSIGILPLEKDCAIALLPGILVYEIGEKGESYLAVAEGILVKKGLNVVVSVRNAIGGSDISRLHESVERELMILGGREQDSSSVALGMESALIQRIAAFRNGVSGTKNFR